MVVPGAASAADRAPPPPAPRALTPVVVTPKAPVTKVAAPPKPAISTPSVAIPRPAAPTPSAKPAGLYVGRGGYVYYRSPTGSVTSVWAYAMAARKPVKELTFGGVKYGSVPWTHE